MQTRMPDISVAIREYDVAVDRASLKASEMGHWGAGTGYSVELTGPIDGRWLESYRVLRTDSPSFFRFYFEAPSRTVLFTCRVGDIPSDVGSVLEILDSLIALTNRYASAASSESE